MARKVVSVALHNKKKKPIKNSNKTKKLKTLLKNVLSYMKSDNYMFAPLLCSHSFNITSSPAAFGDEMSCEPMKKKAEKKLAENVKDYLKCDCYMYAPLVVLKDCASPPIGDQCGEKADIGNVGDQMEPRMEETTRQDGITMNRSREIENGDISNPTRRIVVKHNLLQKETVKHVVHQNCRSSSVPGTQQIEAHKALLPDFTEVLETLECLFTSLCECVDAGKVLSQKKSRNIVVE